MSRSADQLRTLLRHNPAWYALAAALALTGIGIAAIATVEPTLAVTQARWAFIAISAMAVCTLPHPKHVSLVAFPLLAMSLVLLVLLLAPGVPGWLVHPRNGARCWISLGLMDVEPGEVAKIAFVLALARYLRYRDNYRTLPGLLVPFIIMFVPVLLILKQPDLGVAMLFAPALFVVLVAAGAKLRHLSALLGVGLVVVGVNVAVIAFDPPRISPAGYPEPASPARAWMHVLKPYQEARIAATLSQLRGDQQYLKTIGYQQKVAMTLAGAGGLEGYGPRSAVIFNANFLPFNYTDMIFAVIVNRWGFLGGAGVLLLYVVLFFSLLLIAARSKDPFTRLSCVGFAGLTFTQAAVNIGMTMGLVPITGITLPFISYGGTSLLVTFIMIGLAINFASRRDATLARPSFEFGHQLKIVD